jgi:hypothetical protein
LPDRHSEEFLATGLDRQLTVENPEEISRTAPRDRSSILQENLERHDAERPPICQNPEINPAPVPLDIAPLSSERLSHSCMDRSWI